MRMVVLPYSPIHGLRNWFNELLTGTDTVASEQFQQASRMASPSSRKRVVLPATTDATPSKMHRAASLADTGAVWFKFVVYENLQKLQVLHQHRRAVEGLERRRNQQQAGLNPYAASSKTRCL